MPVLPQAGHALASWPDYAVTFGGPPLVMAAVTVLLLPLLYATWLRRRVHGAWRRGGVLAAVWLVAAVTTHADVVRHAREVARLCSAAGEVQVYATAAAEGFVGDVDLEPWLPAGFRYIEHAGLRLARTEVRAGQAVAFEVASLTARHELVTVTEPPQPAFQRRRLQMRERGSAQVLGEILVYRLRPGWVDRGLMRGLGSPRMPLCVGPHRGLPSDFPFLEDALIAATLRPPGFPPPRPPHRGVPGVARQALE